MSDQNKVLFADVELSIHQDDPVAGSKTILPGQYIALEGLASYQREDALAGKIEGARVMKKTDADLLINQAAFLDGGASAPEPDLGEEVTPESVKTEAEDPEVVK